MRAGRVIERFTISPFEFFVFRTRTRFPFRYGIASMTEVPHLFLRTRVSSGHKSAIGQTAEGLPPKWFTKNPSTTFEQDLPELLESIAHAADIAAAAAARPISFFDLWRDLDRQQTGWAAGRGVPALVAGLGIALVERAVLDGLCRASAAPLHRMLASDRLGVRPGEVYPELHGTDLAAVLPERPLDRCFVRHTVGLGDPLSPGDLSAADRVDDGLPQDLETSIRTYGLRYFKVKLSGTPERDLPRLLDIARIVGRETAGEFFVTVDGNENFTDFGAVKSFWTRVSAERSLRDLCRRTIAIEQPVHRDRALDDAVRTQLQSWPDRPPLIIDESDGAIGDVPRALDLGYAGASHKNCKGIVKGLANACLLAAMRRTGRPGLLTGEDLCNLGPLALQQDLAMMALLGITHVERNGHHYYRGLSMLPGDWQDATLQSHGDLYVRHPDGFAHLRIAGGGLDLASINAAPFGVMPMLDVSVFAPLAKAQLARI
jgi:hypothetical protein